MPLCLYLLSRSPQSTLNTPHIRALTRVRWQAVRQLWQVVLGARGREHAGLLSLQVLPLPPPDPTLHPHSLNPTCVPSSGVPSRGLLSITSLHHLPQPWAARACGHIPTGADRVTGHSTTAKQAHGDPRGTLTSCRRVLRGVYSVWSDALASGRRALQDGVLLLRAVPARQVEAPQAALQARPALTRDFRRPSSLNAQASGPARSRERRQKPASSAAKGA